MASLPSVALSGTIKLEPELKKHPSSSFAADKSPSISYQRSSFSTQLDGSLEPIRPLEFQEAFSLITKETRIEPTYYLPLLQECKNRNSVLEIQIIHAHILKTGTCKDFVLMSFLISVYGKCGEMSNSRKVFDNLPTRSAVAWTALMSVYVQNSQPNLAMDAFRDMLESGTLPSNFTLGFALNACSSMNSIELGKQLHAFVIKYKIDYDSSIGNALCSLYSRFRSVESSINVFRSIAEKDVISWTAVISACGENGNAAMGLRLFNEMLLENIRPNEFTLTTVLSLCCLMLSLDVGTQIHSLCTKLGYQSNLHITNSLMYLYLKCGCMGEAQNLFDKIKSTNLVTWNAMISGHGQAMDLEKDDFSAQRSGIKALSIFVKLNRIGMKPDLFTFSSALTVCCRMSALEQGQQLHAQAIKSGVLSDVVVGTALVNMYSKSGSIKKASKAFVEMSTRTLISWTAMITNFAHHGHSQQALQLFEDMRLVGIRPNQITFVGVLAACSHAGMVDEALEYFDMMQNEYRIKPVMDHYGCLIAMFVRLHRLEEAFNIINTMNFEPSEFIWSFLIAECMHQEKRELGFFAAEQLLKLKPKEAETYVMLLKMYDSAGRWQDVYKVREIMKEEKLGRLNDWSWITIKDKIHSFKSNGHLPRNAEMCRLLEELLDKAKGFGYQLPQHMEMILDDDENEAEEDKNEQEKRALSSNVYHSERLAIAYGLLNASKNAPVRVLKSVRMCKNCHDFVKVISLICNREILVRDSRRLHKFENGQCSCADFCDLL